MKFRHIINVSFAVFLLFLFAYPVWSQESEQTSVQNKSRGSWISHRLSDQDVFLTISSIEWGTPDRWSITSRYVHMFEKDRDNKTWLNNLCIALSPGTAGGRFAIGYQGIYSPKSMQDFAIFSEARLVLLRTWGNPLSTRTNTTFVGAELKICLSWLLSLGVGYYSPITNSNENIKPFWGFHFGIGI